jgi:hypothetical protein
MVGGGGAIACALGRIFPRRGAWLGRIFPRGGDWENDWEMDVSSVGMNYVPNVELRYNKRNYKLGTKVR